MRSYSVGIAALALDATPKWVDNTLSQHTVSGVISAERGVARRISFPALLCLAVARALQSELGVSLANALSFAQQLELAGDEVLRRGALTLHVDRTAIQRALELRLAEIMESAPFPQRGRPPRSKA